MVSYFSNGCHFHSSPAAAVIDMFMHSVDTEQLWELRGSAIHGHGLFATAAISEGTRIIEYIGEKITKAESTRRALAWEEAARKNGAGLVYIFDLNKRHDLDGNDPANTARYINHSCAPNCEAVNFRGRIWIVAIRDISPGEELSFDYGYDLEHFLDHPCKCGAKKCIGYIVRKDQHKNLKKILRGRKKKGTS